MLLCPRFFPGSRPFWTGAVMQICVSGVGSKCHFLLPEAFVPPCPGGTETPFCFCRCWPGCSSEEWHQRGCGLPWFFPSLLCSLQKLQPFCLGPGESQFPKRMCAPLNPFLFDHCKKWGSRISRTHLSPLSALNTQALDWLCLSFQVLVC